jgi:hypothetical protein
MEMTESELSRLLIDCLRKDGPLVETARLSSLSPEQWQVFLALATVQRVKSLLWYRLRQKGLDEAVPEMRAKELREVSLRNAAHNLRLYGELRRLLSALKPEGIPLILLKGIFLADAVYENMASREMNDIDVLSRPEHLERIAAILTDMGYTSMEPVSADITINADHHLPRMIKQGCGSFEIHWNLTNPGESYSIDPAGLWDRAVPVHIAGCDTLALSSEDLLLHLSLHTSYQHQFAFGLRPFCDIAETIARLGPALDWQVMANQATRWGWQRGVYLALRMAKELTGADVPSAVLEKLCPADMTETVVETAHFQVFTDKSLAVSVPVPFAELLESRHIISKIRIFWQRVFLPRAIIAQQYSIPKDSIKIFAYYPRRLVDVLRRHGYTLNKYQQNDASLRALTERRNHIARWLVGPPIHRK